MKRVKIAELKSQLSKHLRAVEQGAEIEVTDRDRPIARIVPVARAAESVRISRPRVAVQKLRRRRMKPARWPLDIVELLLEDRRRR